MMGEIFSDRQVRFIAWMFVIGVVVCLGLVFVGVPLGILWLVHHLRFVH